MEREGGRLDTISAGMRGRAAIAMLATTLVVWAYGMLTHTFVRGAWWFYLPWFVLPPALVWGVLQMLRRPSRRWRLLGALLSLPAIALWLLSLLLAATGFDMH